MRKFLFSLFLATALTPAVAQDRSDRTDRSESRSEARSERSIQRAERSADRPARAERSNADRPARAERQQRTERATDVDRSNKGEPIQRADRPARADRDRPVERDAPPAQQAQAPQPTQPAQPAQTNQSRYGGLAGAIVDSSRNGPSRGDHADNDDRDHDHDWSKNWRKDRRYDWWNYRNRYRSLFRLGHYYDPYGWNYRRWSVGFSLWPSYYGSSFWLNDPWMYRLPPAYGQYRWVRYYDDALLVDIYTGQVIDVVYNVFW